MILSKPYPLNNNLKSLFLRGLAYGSFVFLFLYFFKPFGLNQLPNKLFQTCLLYGSVTSGIMWLLGLLARSIKGLYREENWTVGKEIAFILFHVLLITQGNVLLTMALGFAAFSWSLIVNFAIITLLVGIIPISFGVLLKENQLRRLHQNEAFEANKSFQKHLSVSEVDVESSNKLKLPSQNKNEDLEIDVNDLLFIQAQDNYVEVVFLQGKHVKRQLLRASLKQMEEVFTQFPRVFRCHKSYMVNLDFVEEAKGNAQGYRLYLRQVEQAVLVSRQSVQTLKTLLKS